MLKQSPKVWFEKFGGAVTAIRRVEYNQCQADHTIFPKKDGSNITVLLGDNITMTYPSEAYKLKALILREFKIKILGSLKYFLDIEVA